MPIFHRLHPLTLTLYALLLVDPVCQFFFYRFHPLTLTLYALHLSKYAAPSGPGMPNFLLLDPLLVINYRENKILMLTYKSYYNIAPTYLCELISRRESSVNTRLGSDQHQLIMPPISKDCSNTFLDRSFIYAAPCEWNKLSECIRTSSFDSFRKSVKTMLFTQQYG